ncbi:MAG: hypothetical protein KF729_19785 [Sandaracinaceae bacterium]|nr:hypothetical protein [Sandaracinaceae bacterium]
MRRRSLLVLVASSLAAGCGGAEAVRRPTTPSVIPEAAAERQRAVDAFGEHAWGALSAGTPSSLLFADRDLEVLLQGAALQRFAARRLAPGGRDGGIEPGRLRAALASATYAGICVQGARSEEAAGLLGLVADGWVFDRLLLIGRQPSGRRIAAWIEGTFVYSDAGFGALALERIEEPRWEHTDLEIAPCDVAIRNDLPAIAR